MTGHIFPQACSNVRTKLPFLLLEMLETNQPTKFRINAATAIAWTAKSTCPAALTWNLLQKYIRIKQGIDDQYVNIAPVSAV